MKKNGIIHSEISEKIIRAALNVSNTLGTGFFESVYEKALLIELVDHGVKAVSQVPLKVKYKNSIVGDFIADIVVEDKIILELKTAKSIGSEHIAQLLNYLKASNYELGFIINFGNPKLEWKRIVL